MKKLFLIITILALISCKPKIEFDRIHSQNRIIFNDSILIDNIYVIDFFHKYLTSFTHIPLIVCRFEHLSDTLLVTLSGYLSINDINSSPIGYLKYENKIILFDFGITQIINQEINRSKLIENLKTEKKPSISNCMDEVYFFPSWSLKLYNDTNAIINKGVRPPDSPREARASDSTGVYYKTQK